MSTCWKPKPIKGLKIKYKDTVYDKITYMSCSTDGLSFDNQTDDSTTVHINCKMEDAKIITGKEE